ncbi:acyltransferase [Methylomonas sp. MED-D]|uniref:acyltransferase n=1 Tax=Methylomonas sp. MED-D TaxID=3418768 RepID=UPI003D05FB29
MRKESTVLFIDVIRALAAIMVVVIHASTGTVLTSLKPDQLQLLYWWEAMAFNASSRAAVPLFVMISGYLLIKPQNNIAPTAWLKKRLFRIIIPLLAWIIIYFSWCGLAVKYDLYTTESHEISAISLLRDVIQGTPYYHLWFLYMLIGLYLATPILTVYARGADRLNKIYFVSLWVLFSAIPPFIKQVLWTNLAISVSVVSGYVGYFMLGYWLRDVMLTRKQQTIVGCVVTLSIVLSAMGTYLLTANSNGKLDQLLISPMSPTIMLATLGLFTLLKSIAWEKTYAFLPPLRSIIATLSSVSFFLYLSHPLLLDILRNSHFNYFASEANPILGVPITVTVIIFLAIAIRSILNRIPGCNVKTFLG